MTALTHRQTRLLAEIRRPGSPAVWSTGPAERLYVSWRVRTARRDLAALAELGHLTPYGADSGRRYKLARKDAS